MKRWGMLGIAVLALAVALRTGATTIQAVRGSDVPTTGQRLDGTWLVMANLDSAPPGAPPTIPSLQTFLPAGALFEASAPSPLRTASGQGQWLRAGSRLFTASFTFLTFDPQGTQTGTERITSSIRLSEDLQEFRHATRIEQFDLGGGVVFSGTASGTARRLPIGEPPPAP